MPSSSQSLATATPIPAWTPTTRGPINSYCTPHSHPTSRAGSTPTITRRFSSRTQQPSPTCVCVHRFYTPSPGAEWVCLDFSTLPILMLSHHPPGAKDGKLKPSPILVLGMKTKNEDEDESDDTHMPIRPRAVALRKQRVVESVANREGGWRWSTESKESSWFY